MTPESGSPTTAIVGDGRAGGAFATALSSVGWSVQVVHHEDSVASDAVARAGLVLICVPDSAVADVAASLAPAAQDTEGAVRRVVAHCAGSLALDVLGGHVRPASVHPLVALPSAEVGARRLRGAWFAVSGDPAIREVVEALGGRMVEVPDDRRTEYHAAAVVASNHLVALMGQVERIASAAGVPIEAMLDLAWGSLDNVAEMGTAAALTGPVSRGDWATVQRHVDVLDPGEREAYLALARSAARLAGRQLPETPGDSVES